MPLPDQRKKWTTARSGFSEADLANATDKIIYAVDKVEAQLSRTQWLAGDDYSLADINFYSMCGMMVERMFPELQIGQALSAPGAVAGEDDRATGNSQGARRRGPHRAGIAHLDRPRPLKPAARRCLQALRCRCSFRGAVFSNPMRCSCPASAGKSRKSARTSSNNCPQLLLELRVREDVEAIFAHRLEHARGDHVRLHAEFMDVRKPLARLLVHRLGAALEPSGRISSLA